MFFRDAPPPLMGRGGAVGGPSTHMVNDGPPPQMGKTGPPPHPVIAVSGPSSGTTNDVPFTNPSPLYTPEKIIEYDHKPADLG